jgi:hypothetical protein
MRLTAQQNSPKGRERPVFVSEAGCDSFAMPICFGGIRRELPASPGRYLILLRQRHAERIYRPWKWGRFVGEM